MKPLGRRTNKSKIAKVDYHIRDKNGKRLLNWGEGISFRGKGKLKQQVNLEIASEIDG